MNRNKAAIRKQKIDMLIKRDFERVINVDDALEHVLKRGFKGYENMSMSELDEAINK